MQRLEVSGAVRPIYGSLGVKRIIHHDIRELLFASIYKLCFQKKAFKKIGGGGNEALILPSQSLTELSEIIRIVTVCIYFFFLFSTLYSIYI